MGFTLGRLTPKTAEDRKHKGRFEGRAPFLGATGSRISKVCLGGTIDGKKCIARARKGGPIPEGAPSSESGGPCLGRKVPEGSFSLLRKYVRWIQAY